MDQPSKNSISSRTSVVRCLVLAIIIFILLPSFIYYLLPAHNQSQIDKTLLLALKYIFPPPLANGFSTGYPRLYIVLLMGTLVTFLGSKLLLKIIYRTTKISEKKKGMESFIILAVMLMVLTGFQLVAHIMHFKSWYKHFSHKTIDQKRELIFEFPYYFAKNCRARLTGHHTAHFISDLDLQDQMGMSMHRQLAYYLYPIQIRSTSKVKKPDCLVYFGKINAIDQIPSEYEVLYKHDAQHILAIKKGLNQK